MKIQQVKQISEAHCGPAVLEMLLRAVGVEATQTQIAAALGIQDIIEEHGVRPDQLGLACTRLAPQTKFWYKYQASLTDVTTVLDRGFAVGVEWQGLFYQSEQEEQSESDGEGDYGHYSIITFYDQAEQQLVIVDPYKDFVHQDRIFDAAVFMRRWWDTNEIKDQFTGQARIVTDERLMFFVTPAQEIFDSQLGFKIYGLG